MHYSRAPKDSAREGAAPPPARVIVMMWKDPMKPTKTSLRLAAGTAALALLLAGCGGGPLDSLEYESKGEDQAPSVSFDTPVKVDEPTTRVLEEGDGDTVESGDTLLIYAAMFDGADQSSLGDNYGQTPIVITVDDELKEQQPEVYDLLEGSKVGSTFAYAQAPRDGGDDSASAVEIYHVGSKLLKEAEGEEVPADPSLPWVTMEDSGPKIDVPEDRRGDEPLELTSKNLIEGDGEEIGAEDTLYVHYTGVRWADNEQFDSNWESAPTALSLNQVIPGWTEGLKGHRVGDRVLLVIPADQAYGTEEELGEGAQQPAGALVFVVDILGRTDPVQAPEAETEAPAEEQSDENATEEGQDGGEEQSSAAPEDGE